MTQQPELFNAIVVQVPLLDMLRYTAVAPAPPGWPSMATRRFREERAFLAKYSPYQQCQRGLRPIPGLFLTSTGTTASTPATRARWRRRCRSGT